MSQKPRNAPANVAQAIVEALRDPRRRFLDGNSSSSSHLARWDLTAAGFFQDLADGLELQSDRLFLKPKQRPGDPQRYQCVLNYPEASGLPPLDIHVTLSPRGEPPRVMVAVHESDTVRTLPRIHVNPMTHEDERTNDESD